MIMQRTAYAAFACGAIAALPLFSLALGRSASADIVYAFQSITNTAGVLIARGYEAAPALMLGIALLAIVPIIAFLSPLVGAAMQPEEATRRVKPGVIDAIANEISGEIATHPHHAFLEVVGREDARFPMVRDMLRIGREDDNDIRIPHKAVHRYHAAVYREGHDEWYVADLSGADGNGVHVNGKRYADTRLRDGDVIDLGGGRLRFRAGLT